VLIGDIVAPPGFDPKATLDAAKSQLLACYNESRATNPALRGKLRLRINVNEGGTAVSIDAEPGGSANDPGLIACIGEALKGLRFPKPGGTAIVTAPLVFRP
jgi:hypothetical protein